MDEGSYLLCVHLSNRYKNEHKLLSDICSLKLHFLVGSNKRDVISALCTDVTQTIPRKNYIICSNNVSFIRIILILITASG
jgi:hypothetical protein